MTEAAATLCTRCDCESKQLLCEDCAGEVHGCDPDYGQEEGRDKELEDVLEFFKQAAIDVERCGRPVDLADIAARLERGEHR
jgi:hypothetical protein